MKQSKAEKKIQADILKALRKIKGCVVFAHTASPFSPTGHSDTYGSIHGHSVWGEVKCPGEEATKIQRAFLNQVGKDSPYRNTFVWDNVDQAVKDVTWLSRLVENGAKSGKTTAASNSPNVTPPPIMPQSKKVLLGREINTPPPDGDTPPKPTAVILPTIPPTIISAPAPLPHPNDR